MINSGSSFHVHIYSAFSIFLWVYIIPSRFFFEYGQYIVQPWIKVIGLSVLMLFWVKTICTCKGNETFTGKPTVKLEKNLVIYVILKTIDPSSYTLFLPKIGL